MLAGAVVFQWVVIRAWLDGQATANRTDFAEALVGAGATYVANTGFGYGGRRRYRIRKHLMRLFTRHLAEGWSWSRPDRAKKDYFTEAGRQLADMPFDEKVLSVATLYGMPMYQVSTPVNPGAPGKAAASHSESQFNQASAECPPPLTCRQVTVSPIYETHTISDTGITGTYFADRGEYPGSARSADSASAQHKRYTR